MKLVSRDLSENGDCRLIKGRKLKPGEFKALLERAKAGEIEAAGVIMEANFPLCVKAALPYKSAVSAAVGFEDLQMVAFIAAVRKVAEFDEERGTAFSTYIIPWMIQAILRALANRGQVRLPTDVADFLRILGKKSALLAQDLGREPSDSELADKMGLSEEKIRWFRAINYVSDQTSLDSPAGEADTNPIGDLLAESRIEPEWGMADFRLKAIDLAISRLPKGERRILTQRFGLEGSEPRTYEAIGKAMGFTPERARQVVDRALRKMRLSDRNGALAQWAREINR